MSGEPYSRDSRVTPQEVVAASSFTVPEVEAPAKGASGEPHSWRPTYISKHLLCPSGDCGTVTMVQYGSILICPSCGLQTGCCD